MNTTGHSVGTRRLLVASVVLAVLFDILIYPSVFKLKPFGINAPLYLLAFYAVMAITLKGRLQLKRHPLHLLFAAALSLAFPLYNNTLLLVLGAILILLLVGEHMMLAIQCNFHAPYGISFIGDSLTYWFAYSFGGVKDAFTQYGQGKQKNGFKGILLGIAITLPVAIIILWLLLSADAGFNKLMVDLFGEIEWFDIIGHFAVGLGLFTLVSGLVYSTATQKRMDLPAMQPSTFVFNPVAALMLTIVLDVILGVFAGTQFAYLFSGRPPEGVTYAEYVHSGFFQLLAVSVIVLAFIFLMVKFHAGEQSNGRKLLLTLLCAFNVILLVSAFQRLLMYEIAYGYSELRIYIQFFMVALGIVIILAMLYIWLRRLPLRMLVFTGGMACFTVLALMNVNGFIARENVRQQPDKSQVDIAYLSTLSYDAVPYYIDIAAEKAKQITYMEIDDEFYYESRSHENYVYVDNDTIAIMPDDTFASVLYNLNTMQLEYERSADWQYFNINREEAGKLFAANPELMETAQALYGGYDWWF